MSNLSIKVFIALGLMPKLPKLAVAQIVLTYECNAKCNKCAINNYKRNEVELSTTEIKAIIDQIHEVGTARLGFFGGEPLLKKDIFELIAYASSKGINTEVSTNGYLLSEDTVKKLKKAGLKKVVISIDSSKARDHDRMRNLPGCFKKALEGIKYCTDNGIIVVINTVATKENIHNGNLKEVITLGKNLNVGNVKLLPPTLIGGWLKVRREVLKDGDYKEILQLKKVNKNFVLSEIEEKNGHAYRSCISKIGRRIYISCYGDVQPCWAIPLSLGNIREKPLKEILRSLNERMKEYMSGTDCIAHDPKFRMKYLNDTKSPLPIKI